LQLELYHAVEDLLLDRVVWFLRNVELTQGLAGIVAHYREGIAAGVAALGAALPQEPAVARANREAELRRPGVPVALAPRIAARRPPGAAPRSAQRHGGGPQREAQRRRGCNLCPPRAVVSARPEHRRGPRYRHFCLFRSPRPRSRTLFDR